MRPLAILQRRLLSRRLAVALLLLVSVYAFAATLVPRGEANAPAVVEWASAHPAAGRAVAVLGLHRPYASPLFVGIAALLFASTVVCSIERSKRAVQLLSVSEDRDRSDRRRLAASPKASVPIEDGASGEDALARLATELRRIRLSVSTEGALLEASGGRTGAIGSPLFHWALALLMLVIVAGQLTRAEGSMGLPIGVPTREEHSGYLQIDEGPLFAERHTGLDVSASDLIYRFSYGGVDRGPAPVVTLSESGHVVASQRVYPNRPLRYGSLLIHLADYGLAPVFSLEDTAGESLSRQPFLLEFTSSEASHTTEQEFSITTRDGRSGLEAKIQVVDASGAALGTIPKEPIALVATAPAGTGTYGVPTAVRLGDSLPLGEDRSLRFVSIDNWVRVSVANDWTVTPIYALFAAAVVGLGIALFLPTRRVLATVSEEDGSPTLRASWWHSRSDPVMDEAIAAALTRSAGAKQPPR